MKKEIHKQDASKLNELTQKEREKWKINFRKRVANTILDEKDVKPKLTHKNYRDKFYSLLCFEESEHIHILTKKYSSVY